MGMDRYTILLILDLYALAAAGGMRVYVPAHLCAMMTTLPAKRRSSCNFSTRSKCT